MVVYAMCVLFGRGKYFSISNITTSEQVFKQMRGDSAFLIFPKHLLLGDYPTSNSYLCTFFKLIKLLSQNI